MKGAAKKGDVAHRLEADLKARLQEYGLNNVSVKVVHGPVINPDEAQKLAQQEGGDAVIWGWYDDSGIAVRIFLAERDSLSEQMLDTRSCPLSARGNPPRICPSLSAGC